jgi:hypothetical protein
MTTNDLPNSDVLFTEAPASWNTRYVSPEGFECQLTLRGEKGQDLLEKANGAITHLLNAGCKPYTYNRSNSRSQSSNSSSGNGGANGSNGNHDPSWCPIHECSMQRWEKGGRSWFSHRVNGQWCSGKPKKR